jgi:hypothetical protein
MLIVWSKAAKALSTKSSGQKARLLPDTSSLVESGQGPFDEIVRAKGATFAGLHLKCLRGGLFQGLVDQRKEVRLARQADLLGENFAVLE